jgi:CRISPR-associated protein Csb3
MNDFVLARCEPQVLLSHLALYGLASILEAGEVDDVRIGWTDGPDPRPTINAPGLDDTTTGAAVQAHAEGCVRPSSWVQRNAPVSGTSRGLMSPRLTPYRDDETWRAAQDARHQTLDALTESHAWLDLRFLAALGEPSYWSHNAKGERLPDEGASRLEMQPRNRGSEFVGSRLRKLAAAVAARSVGDVVAGLRGQSVRDEAGSDKPDSRTATGLAPPGPTDNALAWCALWGLGQFPLAMRVTKGPNSAGVPALTTGHVGRRRREWFYAPMWDGWWRPARLRSMLAGRRLRTASAAGLDLPGRPVGEGETASAETWLATRGVRGVVRFPVEEFGSSKAPERRAMRGDAIPVGRP